MMIRTGKRGASAGAARLVGLIRWQTLIVAVMAAAPGVPVVSVQLSRTAQEAIEGEAEQETKEESGSGHDPRERENGCGR